MNKLNDNVKELLDGLEVNYATADSEAREQAFQDMFQLLKDLEPTLWSRKRKRHCFAHGALCSLFGAEEGQPIT